MISTPASHEKQRRRIRAELVDVLQAAPLMRAPTSRRLMLDEVRERLGRDVPVTEHAELRLHVVEVVRAYAKHPDGVAALVDAVVFLEPHDIHAAALHRLRDEWDVVEVLAEDDWADLRRVLEGIPVSALATLYQRATRHRLPAPPEWCATAWHAFVHLSGQNTEDGLSPGMLLLVLLEDEIEDRRIADQIRRRNQLVAQAHQLTSRLDRTRAHFSAGRDQPADSTSYLIIQIEQYLDPGDSGDRPGTQRYAVSPCHKWRGADTWHSWRGDPEVAHYGLLKAAVERLVREVEVKWKDRPGRVSIEFVLPWELLNAEVEWWKSDESRSDATVLAMRYPVVVRSLDRLHNLQWHRVWQERWQQLRDAPASSRVFWSHPSGEDYFTRLEAELMADPRVVSLVLSEPPTVESTTGRREIEAALRAGLPVIIWHRLDCTAAEFRDAIMNLISDAGVARLPAGAQQLRLGALRHEPALRKDHVGRHLTVLWDDPERKPDLPGSTSGRLARETR